jgi:c-di-GMP-binding flagellar brake protein YcgR
MDVKIVVETKSQMRRLIDQMRASSEQPDRSDGRRGQWRLILASPGIVEIEDTEGSDEPIYVTTRDISTEGLGFLTRKQLEEGQKLIMNIETDLGEVEIPATVMHCTQTVGMFKVGVKFDLIEPEDN